MLISPSKRLYKTTFAEIVLNREFIFQTAKELAEFKKIKCFIKVYLF